MKLLAITACPTGVAHTYMAAEALDIAAKELGHEIKVETHGAIGIENLITEEDLKEAKVIIIAADTYIDKSKFENLILVEVPVKEAIKNPKALINEALSKISKKENANFEENKAELEANDTKGTKSIVVKNNVGREVYKHFMTGISFMLPFFMVYGIFFSLSGYLQKIGFGKEFSNLFLMLSKDGAFTLLVPILSCYMAYSIADKPALMPGMISGLIASKLEMGFFGGILAGFLAGYIVYYMNKYIKFPRNTENLLPSLVIPIVSTLVISLVLFFILGTPTKLINNLFIVFFNEIPTISRVFLGIVLGGMMAFDMGGPVNKCAYVFGLICLSNNLAMPMAAIMAGGMTPPLGVSLATILFRNKFTKEEIEDGKSAGILGLCFVTEGAMPIAAKNPARTIPAIMIGSAFSAAMSMYFKCTVMVPLGGIFIFPLPNVVGNLSVYIISICTGSIITAVLAAILRNYKKN